MLMLVVVSKEEDDKETSKVIWKIKSVTFLANSQPRKGLSVGCRVERGKGRVPGGLTLPSSDTWRKKCLCPKFTPTVKVRLMKRKKHASVLRISLVTGAAVVNSIY